MSKLPTPEEAARYILSLFVDHFNSRPNHVLRTNNFLTAFSKNPWQGSDFATGMEFAAEQGWVEILRGGSSFRLTEDGYDKAGDDTVDLSQRCNEKITIESQDGSLREGVNSLVTGSMVLVPDSSIPIESGDALLRKLPSGLIERLIVSDPGFYAALHGMPAHYQIKYRREGQKPEGTAGYTIHVTGQNSRVNINSVDNSTNVVSYVSENMDGMIAELEKLRTALLPKAQTPEHYAAIGAIASAEIAAKEGDASKVSQILSALGAGGKWTLDVAKEIGVPVVIEVLKKAVGL